MRRNPSSDTTREKDSRNTDDVFIEWDRSFMCVETGAGIYLITSRLLRAAVLKPMRVSEWVLAGLNAGHA